MTVMCVCPPPPALEDCGLSITSIDLNIETGLTFNYTTTAEKIEVLLVIGEEAPVSLGCEDTDGTYLVPIETIGSIIGQEAYFVFNTSTDCGETICSRTVEIVTIQREIPETGANTIVPATGSLNCYGVKDFSLLYSFLTGVILNEDTGKVTVPAQTVDGPGVVIYYKTCNIEVTSLLFLLAFNEAEPVQMYSCSGAECVADE
ncbi:MAG TPA: hypothetical protein PKD00_06075, partial [Burkholderiales bacterium]|nr:hypothetical protein [Burkholderiales bacterium]